MKSTPCLRDRRPSATGIALLIAATLIATAASALPPTLGNILPRGAARGGEVTVTFQGNDIGDATDVYFHEPGISLVEITPVDASSVTAKLNIAADCAVGTHALRLRTKRGVTNMKLFSVGALTEIQEAEPNSTSDEAAEIALGTTVNGTVTNEDADYFFVTLDAGARLAVEVEALRLGGPLFDPKLRLYGPHGHELLAEDDTLLFRQDAGFVHTAEEAGRYTIAVSEASYGGGGDYSYRLHVGQFPRPFSVVPWGGAPGSEATVTWLGDPGVAQQTIALPAVDAGTQPIMIQSDAGVAPTEIPFRIMDLPGTLEAEPNNELAQATAGQAPGAFDGVIEAPGDVDFFKFSGTKDQVYDVRVWARELGSPLDPLLIIKQPDGNDIASDDDSAGMLDANTRVTLPADGDYTLYLRDHLHRGGATFAYRIELTPVQPTLAMTLLENTEVLLSVPQGGRAHLLVSASRRDFDGPVDISMPDLPAGLTIESDQIPAGQGVRPLLITAAPDAPVGGALARVLGTHAVEGGLSGDLNQEIALILGQNNITFFGRTVNRLAVAVTDPAPFSIDVVAPTVPVVHNGRLTLSINATRAEGFADEINLRVPWLPTGLGAGTAKIAGDATSTQLNIECQSNATVGMHRFLIEASAAGWTTSSAFVQVEVQQPWVTFEVATVETERGKPVELTVTPTFNADFSGSFAATLRGLPNGVSAEAQQFTHGQGPLVFPLTVTEESKAGKYGPLSVTTSIAVEG
ncbi:MAG: PPC domain-containing protein, partial [Candidatus Hydrogenedentes bacterium]|nr:PPC domain-containing protein [Candidatus Hydrogenedentota bacterium]